MTKIRIDVVCCKCGITFQVPKWRFNQGDVKYCSRKCSQEALAKSDHWWIRGLFGENARHWKGGKPKCAICGERVVNINAKYCRKCYLEKIKVGENIPAWKGDNVSYNGLHHWVNRWLGKPEVCEICGKSGLKGKQIHWANKSHLYKRDLGDWIRLCSSCHSKYDNISAKVWEKRRTNVN